MFKFDFKLDDEVEEGSVLAQDGGVSKGKGKAKEEPAPTSEGVECHHISLEDLIQTLPATISYSPLFHPSLSTPLLRRDLFDARFQLISTPSAPSSSRPGRTQDTGVQVAEEGGEDEGYVDAKTDLIKGVYEGGLKTWEGGVDLVEVLSEAGPSSGGEWISGARVLEVGCGTAMPSAFLLRSLLQSPQQEGERGKTVLHLQDYNHLVLSLVTLPNLILATLPFLPASALAGNDDEPGEGDNAQMREWNEPGDVELTPALLQAFRDILESRRVELRFSYGHWEAFADELAHEHEKSERDGGYGLVLSAETIYEETSVLPLIKVLKNSLKSTSTLPGTGTGTEQRFAKDGGLEDGIRDLRVREEWAKVPLRDQKESVILISAKVLYFGVGGGLQDFLSTVEDDGGWWEVVKEWTKGVGRKVVRIGWANQP